MERCHDMKFLVEKLFGFLGSLLSTCSSDLPLLRGPYLGSWCTVVLQIRVVFLLHKHCSSLHTLDSTVTFFFLKMRFLNCRLSSEGSLRKRKSRPQASLTATHSSTLAEEIVSVLRILHSLGQWNGLINDYINAQLSSIGDVMAGCQSEAVRTVYCL